MLLIGAWPLVLLITEALVRQCACLDPALLTCQVSCQALVCQTANVPASNRPC